MTNGATKGFIKAVIIVGILYFITYYISYNRWLNRSFDDIDITYKESGYSSDNTPFENVNYKKIYEKVRFEFLEYNYGEEFFDIYYEGKKFNDTYYLYMGIINLIKDDVVINCNLEKEILSKDIDKEINNIFGYVSYTKKSFSTKNGFLDVTYNDIEDKFLIKINNKCSGYNFNDGGIKTEYYKEEETEKYLYIYEKAFYLNYSEDKNGNLTFNYHSGLNSKTDIIANSYESLDLNKVETYKYTFIKQNNNYYLNSIEKTR